MKKIWNDYGMIIVSILLFVLFIILASTMTGCTRYREIAVPVYVHDTTHEIKNVHDSTYVDRWRTEWLQGDTVFIHDSIYTLRYKLVHDTTYKYIENPVAYKQTVEVEKKLTGWQKFQIKGFWWLLVGMAGFVLWTTRKRWLKWIKRG